MSENFQCAYRFIYDKMKHENEYHLPSGLCLSENTVLCTQKNKFATPFYHF